MPINNTNELWKIYTDGACKGNPGVGGYGYILSYGDLNVEGNGWSQSTTNNQMELMAVIKGFEHSQELPEFSNVKEVTVVSDSQYVTKGMCEWLQGWLSRGWRSSSNKPVKNKELWQTLHQLSKPYKVTWEWVRGHVGHPQNERCDELANEAIKAYFKSLAQ